jgi:hypothetical protein
MRYEWYAELETAQFICDWYVFLWGNRYGVGGTALYLRMTEQDKAWYRVQPELGM